MPTEKHRPGKHPNSLANLKVTKGRRQSYVTQVAAALNWEVRILRACKEALGRQVFPLTRGSEWDSLTLERRTAIIHVEDQLNLIKVEIRKAEALIKSVKDTPLRTQEAHLLALRARRLSRKSRAKEK